MSGKLQPGRIETQQTHHFYDLQGTEAVPGCNGLRRADPVAVEVLAADGHQDYAEIFCSQQRAPLVRNAGVAVAAGTAGTIVTATLAGIVVTGLLLIGYGFRIAGMAVLVAAAVIVSVVAAVIAAMVVALCRYEGVGG